MPYNMTKKDQDGMKEKLLELTSSTGWHKDAIAFGAKSIGSEDLSAIGLFQNFAGGRGEFHFATSNSGMTKGIIEAFLWVAFHPKMLGLKSVHAQIDASNDRAQRAALSVGFRFEYLKPKGGANGTDIVAMTLTPTFDNAEPIAT